MILIYNVHKIISFSGKFRDVGEKFPNFFSGYSLALGTCCTPTSVDDYYQFCVHTPHRPTSAPFQQIQSCPGFVHDLNIAHQRKEIQILFTQKRFACPVRSTLKHLARFY